MCGSDGIISLWWDENNCRWVNSLSEHLSDSMMAALKPSCSNGGGGSSLPQKWRRSKLPFPLHTWQRRRRRSQVWDGCGIPAAHVSILLDSSLLSPPEAASFAAQLEDIVWRGKAANAVAITTPTVTTTACPKPTAVSL